MKSDVEFAQDGLDCTNKSDYVKLLRSARRYRKEKSNSDQESVRIAFLGSGSMQNLISVTELLLADSGETPISYEGAYNGIFEEALDAHSSFYRFRPDFVVILPDSRDVRTYPSILADEDEISEILDGAFAKYALLWTKIHESLPTCQILQSNFVVPCERTLGNLELQYGFSKTSILLALNDKIMKKSPAYVLPLDFESLACYIGKREWFNAPEYFLNKATFSTKYIGFAADLIARQIIALRGRVRKCLVLDLDNTLWGGVVGEEGSDGVLLDPNDPLGEAFLAFQRYVLDLKNRGIILAVCSKNDIEIAREPFDSNPLMLLKFDDISCFVANWSDKVSNIKAIAKRINIGLDSLVFFDDNPTERALVSKYLPEVLTVDVPDDPALYVRALEEAHPFDWPQITVEDVKRGETYASNAKREELMAEFEHYEDYLASLDMRASCHPVTQKSLARFSQLINKSNQFNLRTQRYSEAQADELINDEDREALVFSMKDRFSNYGIVSCVVLHFDQDVCFIEDWVMSCRVIKKDLEKYAFEKIARYAQERGCHRLASEYIPTAKNGMVADLLPSFGFEKVGSGTKAGSTLYEFDLNRHTSIKHSVKEDANGS